MAPELTMPATRRTRSGVGAEIPAILAHGRPARGIEYLLAIADVAQVIVDGADVADVFSRIAHDARALVGAASSTIATLEPGLTELTIRAADGARAELLQVGSLITVAGTLAEDTVRAGHPVLIPSREKATEPQRKVLVRYDLGPAMCVPLVARGRLFGAMVVAHAPTAPPFRAADVALVEAFAGQAAIALEFTRVRDELRQLAVVDERERISRELHDGAIQVLFGLGLELQVLSTRVEVASIAARLEAAVGRIDGVMQDLRDYIADLRPSTLTNLSGAEWVPGGPAPVPAESSSSSSARWRRNSGRRFEHRLRAIGDINQAILDGVDVDAVFQQLAHSARTLVHADSAVVGTLRGTDRDTLVLRAIEGPFTDRFQVGDTVPVDATVLGEAVRTGKPCVVADVQQAASGVFERSRQFGVGAAVAVPLAVRGQVFGTLAVGRTAARPPFAAYDVRLIAAFATQAAISLEYGRARDELNRLAVLGERARIARELHEGVIQTLFGAGMELQALAITIDDAATTLRLSKSVEGIDGVIRDLRNYVFGLRPGILADRQLDRALRELAVDFAQRTRLTPTVEIDVQLAARLSGARATDVVQIVREALSNVARHAQASACRVLLRRDAGVAVLEVADDGNGIAPDGDQSTGHGVGNMRARAAALGGLLSVAGGLAGRGTAIRVVFPE